MIIIQIFVECSRNGLLNLAASSLASDWLIQSHANQNKEMNCSCAVKPRIILIEESSHCLFSSPATTHQPLKLQPVMTSVVLCRMTTITFVMHIFCVYVCVSTPPVFILQVLLVFPQVVACSGDRITYHYFFFTMVAASVVYLCTQRSKLNLTRVPLSVFMLR